MATRGGGSALRRSSLEIVIVIGALLWARRPNADLGECIDLCAGDRDLEAFFGGGFLGALVASLVTLTLLSELCAYIAWRIDAGRGSSLPWLAGFLPSAAIVLLIAVIYA